MSRYWGRLRPAKCCKDPTLFRAVAGRSVRTEVAPADDAARRAGREKIDPASSTDGHVELGAHEAGSGTL